MATDFTTTEGDLPRALAFVRSVFSTWREQGLIRTDEYNKIDTYYQDLERNTASIGTFPDPLTLPASDVCWSCKESVGAEAFCADCGAPAHTEAVDRLRYLICLCHEIKKHEREGRLDLSAAHGFLTEANSQIAALRRKLNGQRIASVLPVGAPPPPVRARPVVVAELAEPASPAQPSQPIAPRRSVLEMLLDPRTIQWLLGLGGAALVVGLVIWLAASELFKHAEYVAVLLGVGNALLLVGGWAVIRYTRYQLAGRGLTLLACLVMPLNLWFYDYQGLITIKDNGHLWVAALVCCVLYVVSAWLLRDPTFVYVFVGGVALTGLLLLAEQLQIDFWQIAAPATFLVVLGLVCVHLERVFPEGEGPFSRRSFGLAFFWSGHAALGAGLLLLLGAQITDGLLYQVFFKDFYDTFHLFKNRTEIVTTPEGRLLALGLVVAGTYAYVYSDLVVRKVGVYIHLAVVGFLWAEVLLLDLAFQQWPNLPPLETVILALALTGLLANFALTALLPPGSSLRRTGPVLALGLCIVPLLLGMSLHFRAASMHNYTLDWMYIASMAATAAACRVGAYLHRNDRPWLGTLYLFGSAGAVLLGAAGLLTLMPWEMQAPLLMLIPLGYLAASRLYRGRPTETPVVWAAHAGTIVLLVSCLGTAFQGFAPHQGQTLNLLLAWFFAEAAVFYLLAAVWRDREFAVYACAATAGAAVWQLLTFAEMRPEFYIGAFAVLGLALLVGYRFAALQMAPAAGLGRAAFQSANALLSLAAVAGALLTLTDLTKEIVDIGPLAGMQAVLVGATLAALFLVRHQGWRRWYLLAAIGNGVLTALVVFLQFKLDPWQKLELVCVALGVGLLVAAHVGWFREREREDDMVSFGLLLGSLLVAVPLTWALLYCRFYRPQNFTNLDAFHAINEVGMVATGLLLLGSGFVMHIKSTTLIGAFVMVVYVVSLVAYIQFPDMRQAAAVYLMIGGGLFFGLGLLLSVYRDRLLALPAKIKRREGVFRVLTWR